AVLEGHDRTPPLPARVLEGLPRVVVPVADVVLHVEKGLHRRQGDPHGNAAAFGRQKMEGIRLGTKVVCDALVNGPVPHVNDHLVFHGQIPSLFYSTNFAYSAAGADGCSRAPSSGNSSDST